MITFLMVATLLLGTPAENESITYLYNSVEETTGNITGESSRTIQRLSQSTLEVLVTWSSLTDSSSGRQRYVVDNEFRTLEWTVEQPGEDTRYSGIRDGNILTITGTLNGEAVDKQIKIDDKPFYNNPAFGLQGFVRSGQEKTEFRTLRPGDLAEYKMKAKVEEHTVIVIQGQEIAAIRVQWGLTGLKSKFFKQNLWFRESDGVFLRAQPREGEYAEFAGEQEEPPNSAEGGR
jgi:hypothetical protein